MKRKYLIAFTVVVSSFAFAFGLCACGNNNAEQGNDAELETEKNSGTDGLKYTLSADGTSYICSGIGTCTDTDITIASWYEGKWVTSIGNFAFSGCSSLTNINIPDSVTSISYGAFESCNNLNYNVYKNVKYLGNANNPYLALIRVNKTDSSSYEIHKNAKIIFSGAFLNCTSLTRIVLSDGITYVGDNAFAECRALNNVNIGKRVISIGNSAFADCVSLKSLVIPDSVTKIGVLAFNNCAALTSATVPDGVTELSDGVFMNCASLTKVTVPDSITRIGNSAFAKCSSLESIIIPDSVAEIGKNAFYECSSLYYNEFNNALYLGNKNNPYFALIKAKSTSVSNCTIKQNTKVIADEAFYNCASLTSVTVPESLTSIGYNTFYNCFSLTSVTVPDSVTSIGDSAFWNCSSLTCLAIPDSVTEIGTSAFWGCDLLTNVTFENTNGWRYSDIIADTSGTNIESSDLADPFTAAIYLTSTYSMYYWYVVEN